MFNLPWNIPLKKKKHHMLLVDHRESWNTSSTIESTMQKNHQHPSCFMKYLQSPWKSPCFSPMDSMDSMAQTHHLNGPSPGPKPRPFRAPAPRNMGSATSGGKPKVPRPLPPSAERPLGRQTQTEMPRGDLGMRCWKIDVLLLLNGSIVTYSSDSIFIE